MEQKVTGGGGESSVIMRQQSFKIKFTNRDEANSVLFSI